MRSFKIAACITIISLCMLPVSSSPQRVTNWKHTGIDYRIQVEEAIKQDDLDADALEASLRAEELKLEEMAKAVEKERVRLSSVQLPLHRSEFWVSGEFGEVEDFRGYNPHSGLDLAASAWTSVRPVASGTVVWNGYGGYNSGCGYSVVVRHHQLGVDTAYCHLVEEGIVWPGDEVTIDTNIGYVGSTGLSTGPHLHLGVYRLDTGGYDGASIDPRKWLNDNGVEL